MRIVTFGIASVGINPAPNHQKQEGELKEKYIQSKKKEHLFLLWPTLPVGSVQGNHWVAIFGKRFFVFIIVILIINLARFAPKFIVDFFDLAKDIGSVSFLDAFVATTVWLALDNVVFREFIDFEIVLVDLFLKTFEQFRDVCTEFLARFVLVVSRFKCPRMEDFVFLDSRKFVDCLLELGDTIKNISNFKFVFQWLDFVQNSASAIVVVIADTVFLQWLDFVQNSASPILIAFTETIVGRSSEGWFVKDGDWCRDIGVSCLVLHPPLIANDMGSARCESRDYSFLRAESDFTFLVSQREKIVGKCWSLRHCRFKRSYRAAFVAFCGFAEQ